MTSASWFYRAAKRPELLLGSERPKGLDPARWPASKKLGLGTITGRRPASASKPARPTTPRRCSTKRPGGVATARCAAGARLRCLTPWFITLWLKHTARLGTGVCLPLRCSHPCSRARRAARRSGSRTRCRRRRRVTARRLPFPPPAQSHGSMPGTSSNPARPARSPGAAAW
jgi:hypothetical protein